MKKSFIGLLLSCFFISVSAQEPNSPIAGWKMQQENGHTSFTPAVLFGTANFHYDIYPPQKAGDENIADWLTSTAEKDVQSSGYTVIPGQAQSRDVKTFRIYSVAVRDAAGKSWLLNYMAYARPDHSFRYGRITEIPNTAVTKNNMNTAVQHFIRLSKQEGGFSDAHSTASNSVQTAGAANTGSSTTSKSTVSHGRVETPTTAPGQGLKPSDIKGVALHQEYNFGVGGMMIIEYNPYLMLNDGTVYQDPYVPAYDLDVAKSREVEPQKWGTWKLDNATTMVVKMSRDKKTDRWEGKSKWFWATPAAKGDKMSGTWSTISGGGNTVMGGGSMVVSSNVLTFNNEGQFTTESTGGGSFSGGTGTVTAYSSKNGAGTYTFDGYSLELKYNNGKIIRKNFCSYDDTKEVWVFGTSAYTPSDSNKKKKK